MHSDELVERLKASQRLAASPHAPSWSHRLIRPLRRVLARLLAPQEAFNTAVTDYVTGVVRPLEAGQEELRDAVGSLHHAVRSLARDLAAREDVPPEPRPAQGDGRAPVPVESRPAAAHALAHAYVGFEDRFRGSPEVVRARQQEYVPIFSGAAGILDIGCGRGEFLALLREHGIAARGVDLNEAMVAVCREQQLDAEAADAVAYLQGLPDSSVGGLFAAQVVEHLEPAHLTRLLDEACRTLRPGSAIVLETINPTCWAAFFESYIRDITHVQPLHPDTLRFLLTASGFQHVEIRYRSPYPEHAKLRPVPAQPALGAATDTLNANVALLNGLLFGHMDYAAVARRP